VEIKAGPCTRNCSVTAVQTSPEGSTAPVYVRVTVRAAITATAHFLHVDAHRLVAFTVYFGPCHAPFLSEIDPPLLPPSAPKVARNGICELSLCFHRCRIVRENTTRVLQELVQTATGFRAEAVKIFETVVLTSKPVGWVSKLFVGTLTGY